MTILRFGVIVCGCLSAMGCATVTLAPIAEEASLQRLTMAPAERALFDAERTFVTVVDRMDLNETAPGGGAAGAMWRTMLHGASAPAAEAIDDAALYAQNVAARTGDGDAATRIARDLTHVIQSARAVVNAADAVLTAGRPVTDRDVARVESVLSKGARVRVAIEKLVATSDLDIDPEALTTLQDELAAALGDVQIRADALADARSPSVG